MEIVCSGDYSSVSSDVEPVVDNESIQTSSVEETAIKQTENVSKYGRQRRAPTKLDL